MPPRRRTSATPIPVSADPSPTEITLQRPDVPVIVAAPEPGAEQTPAKPAKPVFKQRSVYLEDTRWERARAAIAYLRYFEIDDEPDTLAALIDAALEKKVAELEHKYNDGQPFKAARRLPTGPGRAGVNRLTNNASEG